MAVAMRMTFRAPNRSASRPTSGELILVIRLASVNAREMLARFECKSCVRGLMKTLNE
jgi:hypothetical protein